MPEDLYSLLGVSDTASFEEIRKAYYKKMSLIHPDKSNHPENESMAIKAIAAWDILKNEKSKKEYDVRLAVDRAEVEHQTFSEQIQIDSCVKADDYWLYYCRCGGEYHVNNADLLLGFSIFSCSNCSLRICINKGS